MTLQEAPPRTGVWGLLGRLVHAHRLVLVAGLLMTALASVGAMVTAVLAGRLTDAALADDRSRAVGVALVGIAVAIVQVAATGLGQAWLARAGERVVRDLRDTVVERLLLAPLRFVERHRRGDLLQRGTAEVAALSLFVRESFPQLVTTLTTLAAAGVVLALESWQLLLAVLVGFGPSAWLLTRAFRRRAVPAFAAEAAGEADVMAGLAEVVRARTLLRQAPPVGRRHWLDDLDRRGEVALAAQLRTIVAARWVNLMALVEGLSLALLLVVGVLLTRDGPLTVGVVVTFVVAGRTLFTSFTDLSTLLADAEEAATGLARAQDLLRCTAESSVPSTPEPTPEPTTEPTTEPTAAADGRLEARGLCFGYGGQRVLHAVDLTVGPGERVCVVGRTGSGKSTLARLLSGLYQPDAGTVRVGEVELADLPVGERAALVAYLPQEVQLGSGDLRSELRLGHAGASDDDLRDAFARLGLADWLASRPRGLSTAARDELSAGERQLVALVRVSLSSARVLVLDEATSDLDVSTAALVESALDRLAADRAVVVVAHRPETIATFGHVVELVDGRRVDRAVT